MGLSDIKKVWIDLTGLNIEKLGDNNINVNSRDRRKREKGERKTTFWVRWHKKKKKDRQKDVAKR